MDPDWAIDTLSDVQAALDELIGDIEAEPEAVETLLTERMPAVFAKLNYAWRSRHLGPAAIDQIDHDELVSWPTDVGL